MEHIIILLAILAALGAVAILYGAVRRAWLILGIGVALLALAGLFLLALTQSKGMVLIGTDGPRMEL